MKYQRKPKIKTVGCQTVVGIRIPVHCQTDINQWDQFYKLNLRGFFRVSRLGRYWIEFTGPVSIPLYDRLQEPISRQEFFMLMEQILVMTEQLQHHGLSVDSVIFDLHASFINEVTKELSFLYFPNHDIYEEQGLLPFVESIIYSSQPISADDSEYISRFVYFLRSLSYFDIARIEQYILNEEPQVVARVRQGRDAGWETSSIPATSETSSISTVSGRSGGSQRTMASETMGKLQEQMASETGEELDEQSQLEAREQLDEQTSLGIKEQTGDQVRFESGKQKTGKAESMSGKQADDQTRLEPEKQSKGLAWSRDEALPEMPEKPVYDDRIEEFAQEGVADFACEETCLLCDLQQGIWPRLYRTATEEMIVVDRDEFRIGKDASKVDYAITDNRAISRKHAEIRREEDHFYISDLNSKNRTYVNGTALSAHVERELFDGDLVRLADEEFVFQTSGGKEDR